MLVALGCVGLLLAGAPAARADEIPGKYKPSINKGLDWLAKQQFRDGHWGSGAGQDAYPVAMTGLAGVALLSEGSTMREGKYADNIKRAVDWMLARAQPNGKIGGNNMNEANHYMYGHGFAMLFLGSVYGEEPDGDRRKKMEEVLTAAAKYSFDAQTREGGWGYVSAKDSGNFDEGSVTVTQMQGLRAVRNAGIVVPPDVIKNGVKYLERSTGPDGGVRYSLASGGGGAGSPALTAAGICCGFSAGEYNNKIVKGWFEFCQQRIPFLGGGRFGHDEYTHYYYGQALYSLGEDGYAKLFPNSKDAAKLNWKAYRESMFESMMKSQQSDGSWGGGNWGIGPVYVTSMYLTIMQLDNAALPIYQR